MFLFFDTETTGKPLRYNAPIEDVNNWPRLVQLGWILYDDNERKVDEWEIIVYPGGFTIPEEVSKIHGITQEIAVERGWPIETTLTVFTEDLIKADVLIGHNLEFDIAVIGAEYIRMGGVNLLAAKSTICTMKSSTDYCKIPGGRNGYKWPKLYELYQKLFNEPLAQTHTALDDISNTAKCYFELKRLGVIS